MICGDRSRSPRFIDDSIFNLSPVLSKGGRYHLASSSLRLGASIFARATFLQSLSRLRNSHSEDSQNLWIFANQRIRSNAWVKLGSCAISH